MLYKCADCGAIFDEDEIAEWKESRGEFWGMPCYEKMAGCPRCFSCGIDEYDPDAEEENDEDEDGDEDDG